MVSRRAALCCTRASRGTAAVASSGRSTMRKRRRRRCTSTSGIKSSTSTCISTSTKNGGGSSSSTTKCSNGSTGGRSSVAHAGATAPGLIRCTNPHTVTVICTTASTQHPPPGGVRGKAQSARRLGPRWAPSPGFPNNQQPARVTTSSARAWQCPSGRILVVLRELALAREREGRKRPLPYFHASFGWEARPKILEACGAGACFVAFSTIRLPPSSG